jgi:hypothetical protein
MFDSRAFRTLPWPEMRSISHCPTDRDPGLAFRFGLRLCQMRDALRPFGL